MYIDTLTYEEFGVLTELDMKKRFLSLDEKEQRERLNREQENELLLMMKQFWIRRE